jgi:hypothetical protein
MEPEHGQGPGGDLWRAANERETQGESISQNLPIWSANQGYADLSIFALHDGG